MIEKKRGGLMDDDFERALNKFNSRFRFSLKDSLRKIKEIQQNEKQEEEKKNKLKEELELHYVHYSNNNIYQKKLISPLTKKCTKLNCHSDKVILPVSVLKALEKEMQSGDVEHPFTFSIRNLNNNYVTHAGVLEFSSDEGIILVSENIKENLEIKEKSGAIKLLITYVNLPKGNFIRFESLNDNLIDMKCMKHLMENYLSMNYTTLTVGDVVHMDNFHFYISELEPDNAIVLTNTDIEVDICKSNRKSENIFSINSGAMYEEINTISSVNTKVTAEMKRFKFFINQKLAHLWKAEKKKLEIVFYLQNDEHNVLQVFISFPPYDYVSETYHHAHFLNVTKIVINKEFIMKCLKMHFLCFLKEEKHFVEYILEQFFPSVMYIGISSVDQAQSDVTFSLQWVNEVIATEKLEIENKMTDANKQSIKNIIYKFCSYCLKDIPESNFLIHQMHCAKNITLCKICKRGLNKKEILEHHHCSICNDVINPVFTNIHNILWHTKIECLCGKYFYRKEFIFHQKLFCSKKLNYCPYCNIFISSPMNSINEKQILSLFFEKYGEKDNPKSSSLEYYYNLLFTYWNFFLDFVKKTEHEAYCGTKSVSCAVCEKQMYRNEYFKHLNNFHQIEKIKSFQIFSENLNVLQNSTNEIEREK